MANTNHLTKLIPDEQRILITGCAGFIGGAFTKRLIEDTSAKILGIDNMNPYYDVSLKDYRLKLIMDADIKGNFEFVKGDIADKQLIDSIFERFNPTIVVNLAAQAGVRYSIDNPDTYMRSNIIGFFNILEACRHSFDKGRTPVRHLLYASSSSVYGNNKKIPYSVEDKTDQPVSFYAATKKADEVMAYSYSKLYGIPMTGTRFFTVYGPAGRPDMAYYKFTEKLTKGEKIELYNNGNNKRDFTYIDDVINALVEIALMIPQKDNNDTMYKIYNVGNNCPVDMVSFVQMLVTALRETNILEPSFDFAKYIERVESQAGDVDVTYADIDELKERFNISPNFDIRDGLRRFAIWYKSYSNK